MSKSTFRIKRNAGRQAEAVVHRVIMMGTGNQIRRIEMDAHEADTGTEGHVPTLQSGFPFVAISYTSKQQVME